MLIDCLSVALFLAAPQTPPEEPAPPPPKQDLESRVKALEAEVQRLKLQAPDEEEPVLEETAPAAPPPPANVLNPTLTVVGNGLYRYDTKDVGEAGERIDDRFNMREVEVDLRAAVDPFADAVVIVSVESELPNEFEISAEEAFVNIKRLPIPILDDPPLGLKLKVGKFRTEIGRINRLHLHDLPQATRPLVTEELYGGEGWAGLGASGQIFLPSFDEDSALELTAQVVDGGGTHLTADAPTNSPAAIANLRWFRAFGVSHAVDVSAIFHWGRTDPATDRNVFVYSGDFLYKWKPSRGGEFRSFVLGGQLFYVKRDFLEFVDLDMDGVPEMTIDRTASPLGWFAFAQPQLARNLYLGVRYDDVQAIADDHLHRRAISGWLSWYTSEFLRIRLGYEHRFSDLVEEDGLNTAFAELNFVFGSHPTEPFWVNK